MLESCRKKIPAVVYLLKKGPRFEGDEISKDRFVLTLFQVVPLLSWVSRVLGNREYFSACQIVVDS